MTTPPIPSRDAIIEALLDALRLVRDRDAFLLAQDTHECALTHRLAVYLEQHELFRDWHLDCEYNRMWDERTSQIGSKRLGTRCVRPDILVHRRGPRGPNLLALEAKLNAGRGQDYDRDKLAGLREDPFRYEFTALVSFKPLQLWIDPDLRPDAGPHTV